MYSFIKAIISGIAWVIIGGFVFIVLNGVAWFGINPGVGFLTPPFVLFFMLLTARAAIRARQTRAFVLVSYLEQAARLNLPLNDMLLAAERSERGRLKIILGKVRRSLESGVPLGDTLERLVPEVDWRQRQEIAVGEKIGRLSPTLSRLHQVSVMRMQRANDDPMLGWAYGAVVAACLLTVLALIFLHIMPKYVEIFDDFGVAMPWTTVVTYKVGLLLSKNLLPVSLFLICALAGWSLWAVTGGAKGTVSRWAVVDAVLAEVPVIGRMRRDRSYGVGFATIAEGLAVDLPLPDAVRVAADSAVGWTVRRRLMRVVYAVERGRSLTDAAVWAGLPGMAAGMLGAAEVSGGLRETFVFLGSYHASRFSRAGAVLSAVVMPLVVGVMAVGVAWVVFSMLSPLTHLMWSVMPEWGGM